jgi:hypothetical protein
MKTQQRTNNRTRRNTRMTPDAKKNRNATLFAASFIFLGVWFSGEETAPVMQSANITTTTSTINP